MIRTALIILFGLPVTAVLCIIAIIISLFVSCAVERSIEQTINDFATASNNNDVVLLNSLLSEDSQFWPGRPTTVEELLVYMNDASPITFSNLSITENGDDGTVSASAVYGFIGPTPFSVDFVMRRHDKEWKIKEYYDYKGVNPYVWLRIGRPEIVH